MKRNIQDVMCNGAKMVIGFLGKEKYIRSDNDANNTTPNSSFK
jgi:hypothetical protein